MKAHVIVTYCFWSGQRQVVEEDSEIIVVHHYEINGFWVGTWQAELLTDHGFLSISIREKRYPEGIGAESYGALREMFSDPSDYSEDTDEETLVLPVARVEWVEMKLEVYAWASWLKVSTSGAACSSSS